MYDTQQWKTKLQRKKESQIKRTRRKKQPTIWRFVHGYAHKLDFKSRQKSIEERKVVNLSFWLTIMMIAPKNKQQSISLSLLPYDYLPDCVWFNFHSAMRSLTSQLMLVFFLFTAASLKSIFENVLFVFALSYKRKKKKVLPFICSENEKFDLCTLLHAVTFSSMIDNVPIVRKAIKHTEWNLMSVTNLTDLTIHTEVRAQVHYEKL